MSKRSFFTRGILAFILASALLIGFTVQAGAYNTGDDYPYKNSCSGCHSTYNGDNHNDIDPYNFFYRQCTSFVAWCLNSRNGVGFTNSYAGVRWGNAKNWINAAKSVGISVDMNPQVGSVVCWTSGNFGHVAWVRSVSGDNVVIEEYNGSVKCGFTTRTINRYNPSGYIHINDITSTPTPPPTIEYSDIPLGKYFIRHNSTGKHLCVGASGTSNNIWVWERGGYTYEFEMEITAATSGYRIKPVCQYDKVVNVYADTVSSGNNVNILVDTNNETQWWRFQKANGGYIIRNVQNPSVCLSVDSSGYNVIVSTYNGDSAQVWSLESVLPPVHTHIPGSPATCTSAQVCTECGEEISPALGHDYAAEWTVDIPATYDNAGEKSRHCTRCDAKTDVTEIPKLIDSTKIFSDVKNDWYTKAVDYALYNGLMNGTSDTTFEPESTMTRAMLVTVLYRLEGKPEAGENPFTDLKEDWYMDAVSWAYNNGVVNGTGGTNFSPDDPITREQMATILFRYAGKKGYDTSKRADLASFPDGGATSDWAEEALSWAYAEGLITGSAEGGKVYLVPNGSATRAQVATILMRFCEKY